MLDRITPLILTLDEEDNLERSLAPLGWAREIVVIDSGSTDRTLAICAGDPRIRVVHRKFDSHAEQWDFGVGEVRTDWVLALDADYEATPALIAEIGALDPPPDVAGYETAFRYRVFGRTLRGTLYPPRVTLFRRDRASHWNEGHTQRIRLDGAVRRLGGIIFHDDRKPMGRWFRSQANYARREVDHLLGSIDRPRLTDRLRRTGVVMPWLAFVYVLLVRGCILDGRAGLYYAMQRACAEAMIAVELLDRRLRRR